MAITVRVEGADELRALIVRARDVLVPEEMRRAGGESAEVIADSGLPHIPRRSGRLRRSLRTQGTTRGGNVKVGGTEGVEYAAAIHWGRKRGNVGSPPGNHPGPNPIAGNQFLVDAAVRERGQVTDTYEAAIRRAVETIRN